MTSIGDTDSKCWAKSPVLQKPPDILAEPPIDPPDSIFPSDVALAFNNESPSAGQAIRQFALPSYSGFPENARTMRWQISFATAPSAVSVQLQTAMNDVGAQYAVPTGATNQSSASTYG